MPDENDKFCCPRPFTLGEFIDALNNEADKVESGVALRDLPVSIMFSDGSAMMYSCIDFGPRFPLLGWLTSVGVDNKPTVATIRVNPVSKRH